VWKYEMEERDRNTNRKTEKIKKLRKEKCNIRKKQPVLKKRL
jgi:hypothetical protein